MVSNHFLICSLLLLTAACSNYDANKPDEYVIGEKVQNISALSDRDSGLDKEKVVIFDKTTRKIHQFNLTNFSYEKTLTVKNPSSDHYLLYQNSGRYIIDMSQKHLTIFNASGVAQEEPLRFAGTPISAAFRSSLGLLVVYDSLGSVGMLKLDEQGDVSHSFVAGPILSTDDASIAAGDITESGKLVLYMSNGLIAIVDLEQTMIQKQWVYTSFSPGIADVSWVAPVRQTPNQILVKSKTKLALIDINTQTILSELAVATIDRILKLSKSIDPHVVLQVGSEVKMAYVSNSQIVIKSNFSKVVNLLSSHLNLQKDTWTKIESLATPHENEYWWQYNYGVNYELTQRTINRFRLTDLLALEARSLPDQAQLEINDKSIFALFPSELGYAVKMNFENESQSELKLFNLNHIK